MEVIPQGRGNTKPWGRAMGGGAGRKQLGAKGRGHLRGREERSGGEDRAHAQRSPRREELTAAVLHGADSPSRGLSATSQDILVVTAGHGVLLWIKARDILNVLQCTGHPLPPTPDNKELSSSKASIVQRLGNLSLEPLGFWV